MRMNLAYSVLVTTVSLFLIYTLIRKFGNLLYMVYRKMIFKSDQKQTSLKNGSTGNFVK